MSGDYSQLFIPFNSWDLKFLGVFLFFFGSSPYATLLTPVQDLRTSVYAYDASYLLAISSCGQIYL